MTHVAYEEWQIYVKNELPYCRRELVEDHLYSCDQCLELYLQVVAEFETELPDIENVNDFTERIMMSVETKKESEHKSKVIPFYQTAIFHYMLAAAATILLMMTGVFQTITHYSDSVQDPTIQEKRTSVTEGIVNKTFSWIDSFEMNHKEANNK